MYSDVESVSDNRRLGSGPLNRCADHAGAGLVQTDRTLAPDHIPYLRAVVTDRSKLTITSKSEGFLRLPCPQSDEFSWKKKKIIGL